MTRKGMTIQEYDNFLAERGYSRQDYPRIVEWKKRFGVVEIRFNFCGALHVPQLRVQHIGPKGEYAEREEWFTGNLHLPLSRDEFFGTFDIKEEALIRFSESLVAHVYGNTVVPA